MTKILCPNKQYTGVSASVPFMNGVGETENPQLVDWFKSHGYTVEGEPDPDNEGSEFDKMTVDELKAYAEANGIDIGQSTSQKGILKKILEAGNKTE